MSISSACRSRRPSRSTGARCCIPTTCRAHPAGTDRRRGLAQAVRAGGALPRADGEWRWLRSESQPRWDPTGKHIGFIGVAHDITAAKQAEIDLRRMNEIAGSSGSRERTAQLESNEAQMRAIFETSHQYQGLLEPARRLCSTPTRPRLPASRADARDVIGKPFWETPWFTGTEGMSDAVRDAFAPCCRAKRLRIEMRLHLPIGERYFDFAMRPLRRPARQRSPARCLRPSTSPSAARARKRCASRRRWRRSAS